jgi:hypothetical protein
MIALVLHNNRSTRFSNALLHVLASDGWFSRYTIGCCCEKTVFMEKWAVAGFPLDVTFVTELVTAPTTENAALEFSIKIGEMI